MTRFLEIVRAAFVIGRRDFTATVMSKTFLFFLLGPLFPIGMGFAFGGIGAQVEKNSTAAVVAVVSTPAEFDAMKSARDRLSVLDTDRPLIDLSYAAPEANGEAQTKALLESESRPVLGVLTGGLKSPHFTGAVNADGRTVKQLQLFIDDASRRTVDAPAAPKLAVTLAASTSGSLAFARSLTARFGQTILFLLTVLLAGMLLSQLIEEKSSKVIEVLAAAVPVDAIFLGKLFAMLCTSLVGIAVWTAAGAFAIGSLAKAGLAGLPVPAVGWPLFLALVFLYFSMSYLLVGATFLGIGAQASTVRQVQTMSMPVTMAQVVLFGVASLGVGRPDSGEALFAAIFPLSSPYAMIARAAEVSTVWPHLLALIWQAIWVVIILRIASRVFRSSVLKSGKARRWFWQRRKSTA